MPTTKNYLSSLINPVSYLQVEHEGSEMVETSYYFGFVREKWETKTGLKKHTFHQMQKIRIILISEESLEKIRAHFESKNRDDKIEFGFANEKYRASTLYKMASIIQDNKTTKKQQNKRVDSVRLPIPKTVAEFKSKSLRQQTTKN